MGNGGGGVRLGVMVGIRVAVGIGVLVGVLVGIGVKLRNLIVYGEVGVAEKTG